MKVQTSVKADGKVINHNEKQAKETGKLRLSKETVRDLSINKVKTGVKAGGMSWGGSNSGYINHNEKQAKETSKLRLSKETVRNLNSIAVKTGVKAGGMSWGQTYFSCNS